ncbi:TPA: polysaccharide deacetylase family protein, partial [Klebsiella quasipneumoniae]|nr:polysaccharide deacetylase family protein [Klebsiella quasipneumoniae]
MAVTDTQQTAQFAAEAAVSASEAKQYLLSIQQPVIDISESVADAQNAAAAAEMARDQAQDISTSLVQTIESQLSEQEAQFESQMTTQQSSFESSQSERESTFEEKSNEFESRFSSQLSTQESTFSESQTDKENRFQQFLLSSGYVFLGDYENGPFQFSARNQYIRYDNEYYRLNAATDVGFTTTGTDATSFANDVTHFVLMDGDTLRQHLASREEGLGASLVNTTSNQNVQEYIDDIDGRFVTGEVTRTGAFVSFTFDDAYISALDVATAFESRGLKTSFAFGMITPSRTATRLTWANVRDLAERGHEICNQGLTDSTIFSDAYNRALVNAEINQAYDMLREVGVECSGYHASRNNLGASFTDLLELNHAYAFTVANQTAEGVNALQTYPIDPYRLFRVSLYSLGLTKAKAAVDAAIANSGYVAFYDHDPSQSYYATSMSLADLESLLDYCVAKGVTVLPPAQVMTYLSGNLIQGRDFLSAVSQRKTDMYVNPNLLPQYDLSRLGSDGDGSGETYVEKTTSAGSITISSLISADTINGASITLANDFTADGSVYIKPSGVGVLVSNGPDSRLVDSRQAFCFSCNLFSGSSAVNTNFKITLGVDVINSSTNEIVETLESDAVQLDGYARLFSFPFARSNFAVAAYL